MVHLRFTPNLLRHLPVTDTQLAGNTVAEVLQAYFVEHAQLRGYVLDDQGQLRKHVAIFVNQTLIQDRVGLSDRLGEDDEVFVAQALSGG